MTHMPSIRAIYTDGACSGNPGAGGWGVVFDCEGPSHELGGFARNTTNNRMELQAAIEALKALAQWPMRDRISLYSDSEYVLKGITQWVQGWKKKGWKTAQGKAVSNQDLWQELDQLNQGQVDWVYVRGHAGHAGNERADAIARSFAQQQPITLQRMDKPMTHDASASEAHPHQELATRSQHLTALIETLDIAERIAQQGYLITSSELADLMNVNASAVTSRGDQWIWRNWEISRVRREGNQILWQLERVDELS